MTFSLHSCRGIQWTLPSWLFFICRLRSHFISQIFPATVSVSSVRPIMGQTISVQSIASSNRSAAVWMVCVTQLSLPQRHCCSTGVVSADRNTQSVTQRRFAPSEGQQDVQCHTAFPASLRGFHLAQRIYTAHFLLRESRKSGSPPLPSPLFFLFKVQYTVYKIYEYIWTHKPDIIILVLSNQKKERETIHTKRMKCIRHKVFFF